MQWIFLGLGLLCVSALGVETVSLDEWTHRVQTRRLLSELRQGCGAVSLFVQGEGPLPQALADSLVRLRAQGFMVQGQRLAASEFQEEVARQDANDSAFLVDAPPIPSTRRSFLKSVCAKLSRPAEFFGVQEGYSRPQGFKILPDAERIHLLLITEALQNLVLSGTIRYSTGKFPGLAPHAALSAYMYLYIANLSEILRLKNQGGSVRDTAGSIRIDPNVRLVFAQTSVEELLGNLLLQGTLISPRKMLEKLPETLFGSAFSAFGKTLTEKIIGKVLEEQRHAEQRGDLEVAASCRRQIQVLQHVFFNVLSPFLKALQLPSNRPAVRFFSNSVQFLMGVVAMSDEFTTRRDLDSAPCAALLVF